MISSDLEGKGNTYYLKKERLEKDSGYHRKISRICIDKELKTTSDYKHSDLAMVELERSFSDMDNFQSPLWSQPDTIFYPQDGIKNGKKGKLSHIILTYLIMLFTLLPKKLFMYLCIYLFERTNILLYAREKFKTIKKTGRS